MNIFAVTVPLDRDILKRNSFFSAMKQMALIIADVTMGHTSLASTTNLLAC